MFTYNYTLSVFLDQINFEIYMLEWRVAPGLHRSYNDCVKEEDKSYKMQRLSHNQSYCIYSKDNSKDT